ncbi:LysR substrate-binding domain-containing protein [Pseudaestuariivita sp.]|uniref:LysR substrate-binding domain-containing protein n=1 Tax=Pseudaestuariivita sp. TaxID=2211669 RepID=UPI00405970B6
MNLTLKQLRYFEALATQGHFGRAADFCAISQPALSMQIKELERTLGQPLFERAAREVTLTGFGAEFAPRARAILQAVDDLGELARATSATPTGEMRLGVIPTVAPYLLPALIPALGAAHPELTLRIRETTTPRLIEELRRGRIDAALLATPLDEPGFAELPLFTEDFVLVRPQASAHLPVPAADTLRRPELLLLEEGHCVRDQTLAVCKMPGQEKDGLDGASLATLVQMVGAGLGVTLIPEMAVRVETRSADVALARFAGPAPQREIGMVWRRTSPLAAQFRQVAEVVRRVGLSS